MPIEKTIALYTFDELPDARAKERARDWWRELLWTDPWEADAVIEDFVEVARLLGVEMKTRDVLLMSGKTRQEPCVWWRLAYCQGDGAAFDGTWERPEDPVAAIAGYYAPEDETLRAIAKDLAALPPMRARITSRDLWTTVDGLAVRHDGEWYEEGDWCEDLDDYAPIPDDAERLIAEPMRRLASWLYDRLRDEYEYQSSDEAVDEALCANEYTFTETGERED